MKPFGFVLLALIVIGISCTSNDRNQDPEKQQENQESPSVPAVPDTVTEPDSDTDFELDPDSQAVAIIEITGTDDSHTIEGDFLGFSHEWGQAQLMMGHPDAGTNPIYRQLIANLTGLTGRPISIRIGGNSTDKTASLSPEDIEPLQSLFEDLKTGDDPMVKFIAGVNMGNSNINLAAQQAQTIAANLDSSAISAIELGNKPDAYAKLYGYRDSTYTFEDYIREADIFSDYIQNQLADTLLFMGPSNAGFPGEPWVPLADTTDFGTLEDYSHLLDAVGDRWKIISQHAYSGRNTLCGNEVEPGYLLKPEHTTENPNRAAPFATFAEEHDKRYRIAEMNSMICGGEPGVSDAFEASLWLIDILFEYADAGVDGVNIHSNNWNNITGWEVYGAFTFHVPEEQYERANTIDPPGNIRFSEEYELRNVLPVYYGMWFFADATRGEASLVSTSISTDSNIKAWAVKNEEGLRLVLINKSQENGTVEIAVPDLGYKDGIIKRLTAPGFRSQSGITYAGQTFDGSSDGKPVGTISTDTVATNENGNFVVDIGSTEAVLLSFSK